MKVTLCGIELELNINMTDAKEVEKWEKQVDDFVEKLSKIESQTDKDFSQIIREEAECTSKWLDELFGEGTGDRVLEKRADLSDVYGILWTMNNLHRVHMKQIVSEALAKYSPDRALRK